MARAGGSSTYSLNAEPSGAGLLASIACTGVQVLPFTRATRSFTCGATEPIVPSTPLHEVGAADVADVAGWRSRPVISPWLSVAMPTLSCDVPSAVTPNRSVLAVLLVIESSFRLLTDANTLFSFAAGAWARNVASKWPLIAVAGMGGWAAAPSSQLACRPTAVSGNRCAGELAAGGAQ